MSSQGAWNWFVTAFLRPTRFLHQRHARSLRTSQWTPTEVASIVALLATNFLVFAVPIVATWSTSRSAGLGLALLPLALPYLLLTGMIAWAFHAGLVVTGYALSLTASVRSVVVAVSAYLSLALGFAFPYLASARGELPDFLRAATMLAFSLNGGDTIGSAEPIELALAVVGLGYFILAVYLMARIGYTTSRRAAIFVTLLTVGSPIVSAPLLSNPSIPPDLMTQYLRLVMVYAAILVVAAPLDILRRIRVQL